MARSATACFKQELAEVEILGQGHKAPISCVLEKHGIFGRTSANTAPMNGINSGTLEDADPFRTQIHIDQNAHPADPLSHEMSLAFIRQDGRVLHASLDVFFAQVGISLENPCLRVASQQPEHVGHGDPGVPYAGMTRHHERVSRDAIRNFSVHGSNLPKERHLF
jgi:hypothetical protein